MAPWRISKLDVPDAGHEACQRFHERLSHHVHVIQVALKAERGMADRFDQ
jgi:hypothetical protein